MSPIIASAPIFPVDKISNPALREKWEKLERQLSEYDSLIVAFSGGVDSTFLLKAASLNPSIRLLAVIGDSASLPRRELQEAVAFLNEHKIAYEILQTWEVSDDQYASNPVNRCYYCKTHLFSEISEFAGNLDHIIY